MFKVKIKGTRTTSMTSFRCLYYQFEQISTYFQCFYCYFEQANVYWVTFNNKNNRLLDISSPTKCYLGKRKSRNRQQNLILKYQPLHPEMSHHKEGLYQERFQLHLVCFYLHSRSCSRGFFLIYKVNKSHLVRQNQTNEEAFQINTSFFPFSI